jgi:hypothetical protein
MVVCKWRRKESKGCGVKEFLCVMSIIAKRLLFALTVVSVFAALVFYFVTYYLLVRQDSSLAIFAIPVGMFAIIFIFIGDSILGLLS